MKSLSNYRPYQVIYVDAMNICARNYYAMTEMEYRGKKTGMLYGVSRFVIDWRKKIPGIEIIFLWEGKDSWRKEKYPLYKASRGKNTDPSERTAFFDCVDGIKYSLPTMGVEQAWCRTYEADDVAVTLGEEENRKALFSSGDWDWWVLADRGDILYQHRNVLTVEDMGKLFEKKYNAPPIPPSRIRLFKVLCGDDKIPGIPRFPRKLASEICNLSPEELPLVEDSVVGAVKRMGREKWAEKIAANNWIIKRNAELLYASPVNTDDIEWVQGEYSQEAFEGILIKGGMDSLHDRLTGGVYGSSGQDTNG